MNCSRFETLLTDYLEGTLEGPVYQAMHKHFQDCPRCQALSAEVELLRRQLNEFPELCPPADLVPRILDRTTGRPRVRSFWAGLFLPTIQPFLTRRYAFATVVLFVFLSLMVNLAGPPVAAVLSPSRLYEEADRFSGRISRKWVELQDFKVRVGQELVLLSEDLYGRIDYHLISLLFKSYSESIQEQQQQDSEGNETSGRQEQSQD